MKKSTGRRGPLFEVRIRYHGYGVFALRRIRKGTTVIEYLGDRITHASADARYEDKDPRDNHTFLFTVDSKTVIDAGVNGNEARFVNHGCDPNCQSTTSKKRIFIEAIRTIQPGEELAYDYQIQRDDDDPPTWTRSSRAAAVRRIAGAACSRRRRSRAKVPPGPRGRERPRGRPRKAAVAECAPHGR
jgi:SET domain-containing protein